MRAFSSVSASSASRRLGAGAAEVARRASARTGMPLSISVTATPSISSTARPVGSSAPHMEPAASVKESAIGAAVPGTPSMRASPS